MLSDAKLGHFEVITSQQYNGYPWCTCTYRYVISLGLCKGMKVEK